jgi:hypothetical protein
MRTSEVFILGMITGAIGILVWGRQIQSSVRGKTWAVRSKAAEGIRAVDTHVSDVLRAAEEAIRPTPAIGTA